MSSEQNEEKIKSNQSTFTKNDFASLLSTDLGIVNNRATVKNQKAQHGQSKRTTSLNEQDISSLGSSEIAKLLKERNSKKISNVIRYRAEKKENVEMRYKILAGITDAVNENFDVDVNGNNLNRRDGNDLPIEDEISDDETFFTVERRWKSEAEAINRKKNQAIPTQLSVVKNDESTTTQIQMKREPKKIIKSSSESSSEESDEEVDERRSRIKAMVLSRRNKSAASSRSHLKLSPEIKNTRNDISKDGNENDSTDDCEDDDEETTSSGEEESSSDLGMPLAKPMFIPKSKRNLDVKESKGDVDAEENRRYDEKQKRTLHSRALVAEIVSKEKLNLSKKNEHDLPSDDESYYDKMDEQAQRDAWQVRELLRILNDADMEKAEETTAIEYKSRRTMKDDEHAIVQDRKSFLSSEETNGKYLQKFFHRGAFYMDDDTLKKNPEDIRNRAKEYAIAPTGDDKFDKSKLPKIMQVKKFGFAGYSTKYKGLKNEDTTDTSREYMPLKRARRF